MDYVAMFDHMARRPLGARGKLLAEGAALRFPEAGINTPLRLAHFLAQAAHETCDFCYLRELWGPTQAQRRYEGRADLGNTHPGDGRLYMGRGVFQLTGRANYEHYEIETGLPLVSEPDLAARADYSIWLACLYWTAHNLNAKADADDILGITRAINGGLNGLAERKVRLLRAKEVTR